MTTEDYIGFTGSRFGMQDRQTAALAPWLFRLNNQGVGWMRNGDCIGADAASGIIWRGLRGKLHLHPPDRNRFRAFMPHDASEPPAPYLQRNRAIVVGSFATIATPRQMEEHSHGGTWYTVRFARELGRPLLIIWPDGAESFERWGAVAERLVA